MLPKTRVTRGKPNPRYFGLGQRLKRARKQAGLSRSRLALTAGLSHTVAADIEHKSRIPRVDILEKLAIVLQLSPCWLAFGEAQPWTPGEGLQCEGLSYRLKSAREGTGLTRHALGKAASTTGTTVQNIEDGLSMPRLDTIEDLAKVLKVTPCWLAYGAGAVPCAST